MPGGHERNHKRGLWKKRAPPARLDIRAAPPQISAQWDLQRNNFVDNVVTHR